MFRNKCPPPERYCLPTVPVSYRWQIEYIPTNNGTVALTTTKSVLDLCDDGFEYRRSHVGRYLNVF
jgi:hypothetical protein